MADKTQTTASENPVNDLTAKKDGVQVVILNGPAFYGNLQQRIG